MKKKYKEFIKKYHLLDQTSFIEDLLKNDREMKYLNHLKNINWYETKLSTGKFKGTDVDYYNILRELQSKLDRVGAIQQKRLIRKDITAVENSYIGEQIVKKWYSIPAWMSKVLEDEGEVVLCALGSCWWGNTY
jgi:hypothetical protein